MAFTGCFEAIYSLAKVNIYCINCLNYVFLRGDLGNRDSKAMFYKNSDTMTKQPVLDMAKNEVKDVLKDYFLVIASREASLLGRKEVFMGKAKFGIFGDGKELPQIAMAKVFRNGDFR